jgi:hypothetical protein
MLTSEDTVLSHNAEGPPPGTAKPKITTGHANVFILEPLQEIASHRSLGRQASLLARATQATHADTPRTPEGTFNALAMLAVLRVHMDDE